MRTPLLSIAFVLLPLSAHAAPSASELFTQLSAVAGPLSVNGEFHGEHRTNGTVYSALWFSGTSIPTEEKGTLSMTMDISYPEMNVAGRGKLDTIFLDGKAYFYLKELAATVDHPLLKVTVNGLMKRWISTELPEEINRLQQLDDRQKMMLDMLFTVTERKTADGMDYDFVLKREMEQSFGNEMLPPSPGGGTMRVSLNGTVSMTASGKLKKLTVHVGAGDREQTIKGSMTVVPAASTPAIKAPAGALTIDEASAMLSGPPASTDETGSEWEEDASETDEVPGTVWSNDPSTKPLCSGRTLCGSRPSRRSLQY